MSIKFCQHWGRNEGRTISIYEAGEMWNALDILADPNHDPDHTDEFRAEMRSLQRKLEDFSGHGSRFAKITPEEIDPNERFLGGLGTNRRGLRGRDEAMGRAARAVRANRLSGLARGRRNRRRLNSGIGHGHDDRQVVGGDVQLASQILQAPPVFVRIL